MNENVLKKSDTLRLVAILFIISVVTSLLLGLVYIITEGPIAESKLKKTSEAMQAVLPAEEYVVEAYNGEDTHVQSISRAMINGEQVGWVVEVAAAGFSGTINMVVGIDMEGTVSEVSIVSMSETSGLGSNAKNESFRDQYAGQNGQSAVDKDGGDIQSLTGATVTSRAVTQGVNSAIAAAAEMNAT